MRHHLGRVGERDGQTLVGQPQAQNVVRSEAFIREHVGYLRRHCGHFLSVSHFTSGHRSARRLLRAGNWRRSARLRYLTRDGGRAPLEIHTIELILALMVLVAVLATVAHAVRVPYPILL